MGQEDPRSVDANPGSTSASSNTMPSSPEKFSASAGRVHRRIWIVGFVASFCLVGFVIWLTFLLTVNIFRLQEKVQMLEERCFYAAATAADDQRTLPQPFRDQVNQFLEQVRALLTFTDYGDMQYNATLPGLTS